MKEAKLQRKLKLTDFALGRVDETRRVEFCSKGAAQRLRNHGKSWNIISAVGSSGSMECRPCRNLVVEQLRPPHVVLPFVFDVLAKQGEDNLARRWRAMHYATREADVEKLGKVPIPDKACLRAGRCLHTVKGKQAALFVGKLSTAQRRLYSHYDNKKQWNEVLRSGHIVMRFHWRRTSDVVDGSGGSSPVVADSESGASVLEFWFNLQLFYDSPYGPIFIEYVRNPASDIDDLLGLEARPVGSNEFRKTIWQVLD